jgi:hypothetical protein
MRIELRTISAPAPAAAYSQPGISSSEYERRIAALRQAAPAEWVVVYGDREHSANLSFLCGFDPRFEEALLVLGPSGQRSLLVGNEGLSYAALVPVPVDVRLCQSLSLMGQPRDGSPRLADLLRSLGITAGAQVGVVGWKYLEPEESDTPDEPAFVPSFLADALRRLVSTTGNIRDVTAALMHPAHGLKANNTAAQIAAYAWAAERASDAVLRIVRGARPGMTEHEAAGLMGYQGEPLSCHVMMVSGDGPIVGLRSPGARRLAHGDGVTTAIGYWGGLSCRAGLLRETPDPVFVERYVTPYYRAVATWWGSLRLGVSGGSIHAAVLKALEGAPFQPALNPGHLIAQDEWNHTPIRPGSTDTIRSGTALQCDIIPAPLPDGQALNCEDGIAIADAALRAELAANYPELWERIQSRRTFMRDALGIVLADEALPLSTAPAYLPPFWLAPELVCRVGAMDDGR